MHVRRIVTGFDADGRGVVVHDGPSPRTHDFVHIPGFSNTAVWATDDALAPSSPTADPTVSLRSFVAPPGGNRLLVVRFPPSSVFASIDAAAAATEQQAVLPGLAERFDPDRPGFHATPTIDYVFVLEGELWLELDAGPDTRVVPGDVVVQNGTPHAWHNRSDEPAISAAVMLATVPRQASAVQ